mgnify:CR=1 FL=1
MVKEITQLKKLIDNGSKKVVITTHRGPDGDAMGSSLALFHLLRQLGHSVSIIVPNAYASFLHWLPRNKEVIIYEDNKQKAEILTANADLLFFLDFSEITRVKPYDKAVLNSSAMKIMIDHHQDPDTSIADLIFSDTLSSSTAELLYRIIDKMKMSSFINKNIAECLYVGIMTDTGSFKYNSTSANTHLIIAKLINAGAENAKIHDLIYDNFSANRIKLLGYCINEKLLIYPQNNAAIISLNAEELKRFNFKKGDTEGVVNYALAIKGVRFAAFIAEKDGMVKLSLRSKGTFKVNEIANKYFSGGGHSNASGGVSKSSVKETITMVEKIINEYKNELNN